MSDVGDRAHDLGPLDAPRTLPRAVGGTEPLPSVREDPDIIGVHREWARLHDAHVRPAPVRGGMGEKIRRRVAATAADAVAPAQQENRALIGALIRATEALAVRCDELAGRVADLEGVLEEVVNVVSEDLVQIRATLGGARTGQAVPGGSGMDPPDKGQKGRGAIKGG